MSDRLDGFHCLQCGKLLTSHRKWTAEDIADVATATYETPVIIENCGRKHEVRCPTSPTVIGHWIGHDPMPLRKTV